jgi:translation initiation factor 2B subunit (eIF-2B alpha/beta/delta family)
MTKETPTDEEILILEFNSFIKKWCGSNYPHLIDSDENDGEQFRDLIIERIAKLKQELADANAKIEYWKKQSETLKKGKPILHLLSGKGDKP